MSADCLPIALARANGRAPAVAVVHAGWRGLLAGVVDSAVSALGGGTLAAAVGPAIGPCCYEVGEDVAEPFRARFGARDRAAAGTSTSGVRPRRRSGRPAFRRCSGSISAPRAIRSSSSLTGGTESRAASRECSRVSPDELRERYERIKAEAGPSVTVVVATKYVNVDELQALADAGIEVVGENRAQDLEAKHARYGDRFRWHFIGHLQSRKAKVVNDICELCHSLASESAANRLTIPALVEVNLSGEPTKSGISPEELPRLLELYGDVRGLMTMPPASEDPEASRPYFRRLREPQQNTDSKSCRWARRRTTGSRSKRVRRTSASALCFTPSRIPHQMALGDLWEPDARLLRDRGGGRVGRRLRGERGARAQLRGAAR